MIILSSDVTYTTVVLRLLCSSDLQSDFTTHAVSFFVVEQ